jgi:hypothetical protein
MNVRLPASRRVKPLVAVLKNDMKLSAREPVAIESSVHTARLRVAPPVQLGPLMSCQLG